MLVKRIKEYKNTLTDFATYLKANNVSLNDFFTKIPIDKQYNVICKYIESVLWYRVVIKNGNVYLIKDNPIWESQVVYKEACDNDKEFALECIFRYFEECGIRAYGKCSF